jgi:opacity protein-like surface antigen
MTKRFALAASAVGVLALLGGCSSYQNASISDHNAPGGAVRATFRGKQGDSPRRLGAGVEVGYESYRAEGTQSLGAGETLAFRNEAMTTFTGPQELAHDARLSQLYMAYNHRFGIGSHLELEPYVGATRVRVKVVTTPQAGAGVRVIDDTQSGVTVGFTPRWRFNDKVAVELRYNAMRTGRRHASGVTSGSTYEAVVVLSPVDQVALRLGWVDRKHKTGDDLETFSSVDIRSRGPMASLQLDF